MNLTVLDSSAVLAVLLDEPGANVVNALDASQKVISSVNFEEVRTKLIDRGMTPEDALQAIGKLQLRIEVFAVGDAVMASTLRPSTRQFGLSLGDRACLALGQKLNAVVMTSDQTWKKVDLPVKVELIR